MSPAKETATFADALGLNLVIAGTSSMTPDERRAAFTKAFEIWPKLCRRMADLEELAPREADDGLWEDARLMAWAERRQLGRAA